MYIVKRTLNLFASWLRQDSTVSNSTIDLQTTRLPRTGPVNENSVLIGKDLTSAKSLGNSVVIGSECEDQGYKNVVIGHKSKINDYNYGTGVAIGSECQNRYGAGFAGGATCTSGGNGGVAIGQYCTCGIYGSGAIGQYAYTDWRGAFVFGGDNAGSVGAGTNQVGLFCSRTLNTTDASSTILTTAVRMVIPAKRVFAFRGFVTAYSNSTDTYRVKVWSVEGVISRDNSNSTRIVGTPTISVVAEDTDATTWAVTDIAANDTQESLEFTVTGEAGTGILWQVSLFTSQLGYA